MTKQQEFFKKWKSKYPNSYKKFNVYIDRNFDSFINNEGIYIFSSYNILKNIGQDTKQVPFEMLTGVVEKFFQDNGIVICDVNLNKPELQMSAYLDGAEILEKEMENNGKKIY